MPRIGESARMDSFHAAIKAGKEIGWQDIVQKEGVIGGLLGFYETDAYYRANITGIELKNGEVYISCSNPIKTQLDDDGDAVGLYNDQAWEPARAFISPISFSLPKADALKQKEIFIHTGQGTFPTGNWAIENKKAGTIEFCGGSAKIILKRI